VRAGQRPRHRFVRTDALLERFERPDRSQDRRSSHPGPASIPGSSDPEPGQPHTGRRRPPSEPRSPGRANRSNGHTAPPVLDSAVEHVAPEKPATGRRRRRCHRLHQPRGEARKALQPVPCGRLRSRRPHQAVEASRPEPAENPVFPLEPLARHRPRSVEATPAERDFEAVRVSWRTERRRKASSRLVRPMGLFLARVATCRARTGFASPSASLSRPVASSRQPCTPGPCDRVWPLLS